MIFLEHSTYDEDTIVANLGLPDYSYWFVRKAFRRMLARFGAVVPIVRPERDVDRVYKSAVANGIPCVFLPFMPPQYVPTDLACPTAPVFAWEFDTIPTETWNANQRDDWRYVFARTKVAVTHSQASVEAVRRTMGAHFPIWSIPAPVHQGMLAHRQTAQGRRAPFKFVVAGALAIDVGRIDRSLFAPERAYGDGVSALRLLRREADDLTRAPQVLDLDGVVYTAVFNPADGRKNWIDMTAGFIWAFRHTSDATLILKLAHADMLEGVPVVLEHLSKLGPFACRIIIIHGMLDDDAYAALVDATCYAVNTSDGEGQCLPLMEFMSAGRPAVAPFHTAMMDYISPENAFVVASRTRPAFWPHDERQATRCVRHEISFSSLVQAFQDSYRVACTAPDDYARMSDAATSALEAFCSDAVVADRLSELLLHLGIDARRGPGPLPRPALVEKRRA
jgi:glycosyltransferase involved in cell wall biosynthesis